MTAKIFTAISIMLGLCFVVGLVLLLGFYAALQKTALLNRLANGRETKYVYVTEREDNLVPAKSWQDLADEKLALQNDK